MILALSAASSLRFHHEDMPAGIYVSVMPYLHRHGVQAVSPVKEDQTEHRRNRVRADGRPPTFGADRNTIERCFNKLKAFRAVATRYDKRERIYQGNVASIRIWLRGPVI